MVYFKRLKKLSAKYENNRERMRRVVVAVMIWITLLAHSVDAKQASLEERRRFAQSVADTLHEAEKYRRFPARVKEVEIGVASIAGSWAIADWRSRDRNANGQVLFRHMCDHWVVWNVTVGEHFNLGRLTEKNVPQKTAKELLAEISSLEKRHVVYVPPPKPGITC